MCYQHFMQNAALWFKDDSNADDQHGIVKKKHEWKKEAIISIIGFI